MRTGTVLYADNHKASPVAGNQDALGVLRYLKDSQHEVCVFGMAQGDFGCPVFNVNMSGLDDLDDPPLFHERADAAIAELAAWKPDVCLNVAGAAPTISDPANEWGVRCQMWATRTVMPCLKACHVLDLPRHVVINDPRNYPKDHEVHYWPRAVPASLLSQRPSEFTRIVRGRKQCLIEVDASAENWWSYGMPYLENAGTKTPIILAHSHFDDKRVNGNGKRESVWDDVIDNHDGPLAIYGKGWETTRFKCYHCGLLKHDEVQQYLAHHECGPMIPIESNFNTGKLREYVLAGCTPRPVVSPSHTYDAREKYVPLDHPTRVHSHRAWSSWGDKEWVEHLRQKTAPDFSALERALAGEKMGGVEWLE